MYYNNEHKPRRIDPDSLPVGTTICWREKNGKEEYARKFKQSGNFRGGFYKSGTFEYLIKIPENFYVMK